MTDAELISGLTGELEKAHAEIERRRLLGNADHDKIAKYAEELREARAEIARLRAPPEGGEGGR